MKLALLVVLFLSHLSSARNDRQHFQKNPPCNGRFRCSARQGSVHRSNLHHFSSIPKRRKRRDVGVMAGGPPPPDPSEKQKNEGDRRVAIILRGKKVLEYSIPGFIPEWMLPEITPPSVFDDPMGTFEPTFGSVQRPRTLGKKRTEETRGAAQQEHASAVRQNDTDGERGRRVYDWSSGKDRRISRSAPSSTPPGSSSGEHSKRTYGGVDYSNNDLTRQRSEGSETSQRGGGLGIGGTTVLILYIIAFFAIGLLGLLEDLGKLEYFDGDTATTFAKDNLLRKDW